MPTDIEPIERWGDKLWAMAGRSRRKAELENSDLQARTRTLIRANVLEEAATGLDEAIQQARPCETNQPEIPMIPFTLPTPNPPHAPPDGDNMVAIWHEIHGLIRGRRIGNSWYRLMSRSRIAHRLEPQEVLGWWPDPKPHPDQIIKCATCDDEIHVPVVRHEPDGRIGPDYRSVPDGWQLKPAPLQARFPSGTVWSCPECACNP